MHTDLRIFMENFLTTKLRSLTQRKYLGRQTQKIKAKIFQKSVQREELQWGEQGRRQLQWLCPTGGQGLCPTG